MEPALCAEHNAGSKKKKLSTKARALEPAMGSGSDGLRTPAGCRCVIWISDKRTVE